MKHVYLSPKMDLIQATNEDVLTASANAIDANSNSDSNKYSTGVKVKVNIYPNFMIGE